MHNEIASVDPYFNQSKLLDTHEKAKDESLAKVSALIYTTFLFYGFSKGQITTEIRKRTEKN